MSLWGIKVALKIVWTPCQQMNLKVLFWLFVQVLGVDPPDQIVVSLNYASIIKVWLLKLSVPSHLVST